MNNFPTIAEKDKAIPNKMLFVSLNETNPYRTEGKYISVCCDLLSDIIYEIGSEMAFMAKDNNLGNKHDIVLDYKLTHPEEFANVVEAINRQIIRRLFSTSVSGEINVELPEGYVDWLRYSSNPSRANIGNILRNNNNSITLTLEDIYDEYIKDGICRKLKNYIASEPTITVITFIDMVLEDGPFMQSLKESIPNNAYHPYNSAYILTEIGYMYYNGTGADKDFEKSLKYFHDGAALSNMYASNMLGYMYQNGQGTHIDLPAARSHYQTAAELGNAESCNSLGLMYQDGIGGDKDHQKAFEWYSKSAELGSVNGMANLGYCYYNGIGVSNDYHKAVEWLEKSASIQRIPFCSKLLGNIYFEGLLGSPDYSKAWDNYTYFNRESRDDTLVEHRLGWMYVYDKVPDRDVNGAMELRRLRHAATEIAQAGIDLGVGYVNLHSGSERGLERAWEAWSSVFETGKMELAHKKQIIECLKSLPFRSDIFRMLLDVTKWRIESTPDEITESNYQYVQLLWENHENEFNEVCNDYIQHEGAYNKRELADVVKWIGKLANEYGLDKYEPAKALCEEIAAAIAEIEEDERISKANREAIEAAQRERQLEREREEAEKKAHQERLESLYNQTDRAIRTYFGMGNNCSDIPSAIKLLIEPAKAGYSKAKAFLAFFLMQVSDDKRLMPYMESIFTTENEGEFASIGQQQEPKRRFSNSDESLEFTKNLYWKYRWGDKSIHPDCWALKGWIKVLGIRCKQDVTEGIRLLETAIRGGSSYGLSVMGSCYLHGIGHVKDPNEAARLARKANLFEDTQMAHSILALTHNEPIQDAVKYGDPKIMAFYGAQLANNRSQNAASEKWLRAAYLSDIAAKEVVSLAADKLKAIGAPVPERRSWQLHFYFTKDNNITLNASEAYDESQAATKSVPTATEPQVFDKQRIQQVEAQLQKQVEEQLQKVEEKAQKLKGVFGKVVKNILKF